MTVKKVLIIDYSASIRMLIKMSIRKYGCDICDAVDGADGIKRAHAEKFDIIFTAYDIPEMNAFEMIEKIREIPGYSKTPFVVIATNTNNVMAMKRRKLGVKAWITKPFQPMALAKVMDHYISKPSKK